MHMPCAAHFPIALALGVAAAGQPANGQNWLAVSLHPPGASSSTLNHLDATRQVGAATFGGVSHAMVWNGSATAYTDLHPSNLINASTATGFWNGVPVGSITVIGGYRHAVKWPTTPAAYVDLMPNNMAESQVWGAGDGQMCGWARGGPYVAGYWTSNDNSWVPLTAGSATFTYATACAGGTQVGWRVDSNQSHATMWSGSSASWLNLQPSIASNLTSAAFGTDGIQQVGNVRNSVTNSATACVWAGSAASIVYLNPPGVTTATAYDVCGGKQVGSYTSPGGSSHACLWSGTSTSLQDLHAALPVDYTTSSATTIACVGNLSVVGGIAYNAALGRNEAVMWIEQPCQQQITLATNGPAVMSICGGNLQTSGSFSTLQVLSLPQLGTGLLLCDAFLLPTPWLGGTLMSPAPILLGTLAADANGTITMPLPLGGLLPPGFFVHAQTVYADPTLPGGAGQTNAVRVQW